MTSAPEQMVEPRPPGDEHDDDDRGLEFTGRSVLTLCGFLAAMILGLYLLLPQLAGLEDTWSRIEDGSPFWILVALVLTLGMFWGYIEMFRGVFSKVGKGIIGRTESFLITMAGLAASRIFAAGGAGGLVLQAWALRQGVCQDMAHVMVAMCRSEGIPARYVAGYRARDDGQADVEAPHGWVEALVPDLGWVAFDPVNGICTDDAYLRVACGLDYRDAAPVAGARSGGGGEDMTVKVQVSDASQQAQMQMQA